MAHRRTIALALLSSLVFAAALTPVTAGQMHDPDPEAFKAFVDLVDAYRKRPGLRVKTKVEIEIAQGGQTSGTNEVNAEFVLGRDRHGVVQINGFTCWLDDGRLTAVHGETDHSYYRVPDDGSPYYALMSEFQQMPFPHLAIAFGEQDHGDLCMQFHQMAPWIQPTGIATVERDGSTLRELRLTSDYDEMVVLYDPETKLIERVELEVSGGDFVQPGATMTFRHTFEYEPLASIREELAFDAGERQRVDVLAALQPATWPGAGGAGGHAAPAGGGLAGKEAPEFVLATLQGGAIVLEDLRGKVVILDFWATWCPPCRAAMPMLHEVARWGRENDVPLEVVTVNVWEQGDADQRLKKVGDFWKKEGYTLPVAMDFADETAVAFGVKALPTTVVIGPDGVVHTQHTGLLPDYVDAMKRDVQAAIDAQPGPAQ